VTSPSIYLAVAFALGVALVLARQALMWIAFRRLKPAILHRLGLPEGHRIRQPMRFGIVYVLATWSGRLGFAFLIALVMHLVLLGLDRSWTLQVSAMLTIVAGIAAALFALDRLIASRVRNAVGLPADWRAKAL